MPDENPIDFDKMTKVEKTEIAAEFAEQYGTASFMLAITVRMEQMNPRREWEKGVENAINRLSAEKRDAARKVLGEILEEEGLSRGSL
jgi:hypothetical protein